MSLDLYIRQMPLEATPTHSDHTWNVVMNDYSAYTDIRLVVDIYSNPYLNDSGSTQTSGKIARLLIPPNQFGNCIFNVETIIYNLVEANPRNLGMIPTGTSAQTNPYLVRVADSQTTSVEQETNQATIVNDRTSTISYSNGFNGGYEGFENIYHINEYRCLFGVQYTTTGTSTTCLSAQSITEVVIPTDYSAYTSYSGGTISVTDASTQPYGIMIWPGVQENKQMSIKYYYSGNNLNGQYNYLNTNVYDYEMGLNCNTYIANNDTSLTRYLDYVDCSGGTQQITILPFTISGVCASSYTDNIELLVTQSGTCGANYSGLFMSTFGSETIPMTILGSQAYQTRFRTHYYKCPIIVGFMYGGNPLFNNTLSVEGIAYLQKTQTNGQMNYDAIQVVPIEFTPRTNTQIEAPYSYLQQRIAYGIFKPNPVVRTDSDVAIFLTNDVLGYDYDVYGTSELVQYKMVGEECFNDPVSFLFLNRNGIWDTYTFTKKFTKKYNVNKKTYSSAKTLNTQWWNRQSYDQNEQTFYGDAEEMVTVDSGFVQQNDVDVIEGLLMSPSVYMIMDNWLPGTNQNEIYPYLIPCTVQNKEVKEFIQKYVRIFQYTIEIKQVPYRNFILPF
jgi:hypothetical protein